MTHEAARDDTLRINARQNTLTMSTPVMDNAIKYSKFEEIRIGQHTYAAVAYITAPEDTSKGVMHGVPESESQEDIEKSLVTNRNLTILYARRMGRTNSIVIVIEGAHVPHYVYYRGAEYRCLQHTQEETRSVRTARAHRPQVGRVPQSKQQEMPRMWYTEPNGRTPMYTELQIMRQATHHGRQEMHENLQDSISTKATTVGENAARVAETQRRRPDVPLERAAEPQQH
ncbi:hypothetical protein HPB49_023153 [Dermacentor silvarum]|uniref:Uncharacterized protein n=1 Tax=Dermacentor silvarum TaxID=543639 RepID=A0ACB8CI45_DERSI|nr:hypothetical protein HPB49_023153 [Dermacentor silvarum]